MPHCDFVASRTHKECTSDGDVKYGSKYFCYQHSKTQQAIEAKSSSNELRRESRKAVKPPVEQSVTKLVLKRNEYDLYVEDKHGIVFDKDDKKAYGVFDKKTHKVTPLTESLKRVCDKNGWRHKDMEESELLSESEPEDESAEEEESEEEEVEETPSETSSDYRRRKRKERERELELEKNKRREREKELEKEREKAREREREREKEREKERKVEKAKERERGRVSARADPMKKYDQIRNMAFSRRSPDHSEDEDVGSAHNRPSSSSRHVPPVQPQPTPRRSLRQYQ